MLTRNLVFSCLIGTALVVAGARTSRAGGDTTDPITTVTLTPEPTEFGWNNDDVTVDLFAEDDESEVESITYWATGADPIGETTVDGDEASFDVIEEGVTVVHFFATDEAGNEERERTVTVRIDRTDPIIRASVSKKTLWPPNGKTINVVVEGVATDALSGIDLESGEFEVIDEYNQVEPGGAFDMDDDGSFRFSVPLTASRLGRDRDGRTYTLKVSVLDEAGNVRVVSYKILVPHDQRGGGGKGRGNGGNGNGNGNGRGNGNGNGRGRGNR